MYELKEYAPALEPANHDAQTLAVRNFLVLEEKLQRLSKKLREAEAVRAESERLCSEAEQELMHVKDELEKSEKSNGELRLQLGKALKDRTDSMRAWSCAVSEATEARRGAEAETSRLELLYKRCIRLLEGASLLCNVCSDGPGNINPCCQYRICHDCYGKLEGNKRCPGCRQVYWKCPIPDCGGFGRKGEKGKMRCSDCGKECQLVVDRPRTPRPEPFSSETAFPTSLLNYPPAFLVGREDMPNLHTASRDNFDMQEPYPFMFGATGFSSGSLLFAGAAVLADQHQQHRRQDPVSSSSSLPLPSNGRQVRTDAYFVPPAQAYESTAQDGLFLLHGPVLTSLNTRRDRQPECLLDTWQPPDSSMFLRSVDPSLSLERQPGRTRYQGQRPAYMRPADNPLESPETARAPQRQRR